MSALNKVFNRTVKLPSISRVVYELVEMTKNDGVELDDIIEKVRQDQTIAAKVIRVANSSFYGRSRQVSSIENAINIVGLQTLRTTVITTGVMGAFPNSNGLNMARYWHHELTCAFMAMEIARGSAVDIEEAFTAGLMHGLGVLLIHMCLPEEALQIAKSIDPLHFIGRIEIDNIVLGFSHNIACAELLDRWKFPARIGKAIRDYSNDLSDDILCKIIRTSSHYATLNDFGYSDAQIFELLDSKQLNELGLTQQWFEKRGDIVKKAVESIVVSA